MNLKIDNPQFFQQEATTYKIKIIDGVAQGFAISNWRAREMGGRGKKVAVVTKILHRDPDGVYAVTRVIPTENARLGRNSKSGTYAWCWTWDEARALFAEEVAKFELKHGAFGANDCPTCTCMQ